MKWNWGDLCSSLHVYGLTFDFLIDLSPRRNCELPTARTTQRTHEAACISMAMCNVIRQYACALVGGMMEENEFCNWNCKSHGKYTQFASCGPWRRSRTSIEGNVSNCGISSVRDDPHEFLFLPKIIRINVQQQKIWQTHPSEGKTYGKSPWRGT